MLVRARVRRSTAHSTSTTGTARMISGMSMGANKK